MKRLTEKEIRAIVRTAMRREQQKMVGSLADTLERILPELHSLAKGQHYMRPVRVDVYGDRPRRRKRVRYPKKGHHFDRKDGRNPSHKHHFDRKSRRADSKGRF